MLVTTLYRLPTSMAELTTNRKVKSRNLGAGYIVDRPMLTPRLSAVFLPRLGIDTRFVVGDKAEDFAKAIDEKTKAVYIERYD